MRVLFLTHRLPFAPNRGDRIRAYHILSELASWSDVDLASLVHDRHEAGSVPLIAHLASRVRTAPVTRIGSAVRGLAGLATGQTLTHAVLDTWAFRASLDELVAGHRPDVVLAYCSGMARFALEPPLDRLPLVLDMVDVDSEKWRDLAARSRGPKRWIYARESRLLARFESDAMRRAHTTLVVNEREHASALRLAPQASIAVVQNGIDLNGFRPAGPPSSESAVVFCGVMNYRPNEDAAWWLIREIWPRVRQARPDARLFLVGSQPPSALCRAAESNGSVEVTGTVPDVRPYLWKSAVAVAPLQVARGVQNKVLEALAAGLPTVVTPAVADGLPAAATPGCVTAATAEAFAGSVIDLLERAPSARRAIADRADLSALTWSHQLAPLRSILEAAADRPSNAA